MDTKALAKSKRAHSLHLSKKHHHHQAAKAPSTSTSTGSGTKIPTGKQIKVKPQPSHGSGTLPSNWDRYDEEFHLESEGTAPESTSQPSDFVVPKSIGADYSHLVLEATAQSQANYSSDSFLLFNDGLEDFTQDFGPLLSTMGQSMISWIADDNFEFEDRASTSHEAAFLSLNLNDLAEQLAKAKPSERVFLEPDLLPPELLDDALQAHSEERNQVETCVSSVALDTRASSLGQFEEGNKNAPEDQEPMSDTITTTKEIPITSTIEGLKHMEQTRNGMLELQGTLSTSPNFIPMHKADSASGSLPIFAAASAEAELDMLLNSFNETKFLEPSGTSSSEILSTAAATSAKKTVGPVNIDDTIDKLLQETSDLTKIDDIYPSHGLKASFDIPSTIDLNSKSKPLDDFDSWLDSI